AYLSHYALYALMIAMPLIGWAMLSAGAYPIVVFGRVWLPAILPQSDRLHTLLWDAHFYLAFVFFALVLMHVAAALFHALVRQDGVFESMAPELSRMLPHDQVAPAECQAVPRRLPL
ncbi:MAG TPA: cytochrome b/b6 domain-containing protein, partial [Roseiarcus sp.]